MAHDHNGQTSFIGIYPRSQVSVYRTVGPIVIIYPIISNGRILNAYSWHL